MSDAIDRAHLKDSDGFSPPVHRFDVSDAVVGIIRRHWIPVWDLPPGQVSAQRVLRYPVCLVTVAPDSALLIGPASGLSTKELRGCGWTAGLMLEPAAGALLLGGPVSQVVDRSIPVGDVPGLDASVVPRIREVMDDDPSDPRAQQQARALIESAVTSVSLDDEGIIINEIVQAMENDTSLTRVSEVAKRFHLGERSLQRLFARRVGLSPKWVIQRRRIWDAVEALHSTSPGNLANVAADLGYTDQAHFSRDFTAVLGMTPAQFARDARRVSGAGF